jgi:hypothetical protein
VLQVVSTLLFRMELLFGRETHASTTQTTSFIPAVPAA